MRRHIIYYMLSTVFIITSFALLTNTSWQWFELWNTNTILNTDVNEAINTDNWNWTIWDPIREWAYQIVHSNDWTYTLSGIISNNQEITEHSVAVDKTLNIIKNIINYALWLTSFIALIYLLRHWFMIITAGWDDAKYKKWLAWIKYAIIAMWWIWLSRFIISFIFWVITNITQ